MDIKDLRQKSAEELKTELLSLRKEQFNYRMQKATGQLTQTHNIERVRRDIARLKMVLGEKN